MKDQGPVQWGHTVLLCPPSRPIFWAYVGCGIRATNLCSVKGRGQVLSWMRHLINQEVIIPIGYGDISTSAPWKCPWGPPKFHALHKMLRRYCADTNLDCQWVLPPDLVGSAYFKSKILPLASYTNIHLQKDKGINFFWHFEESWV